MKKLHKTKRVINAGFKTDFKTFIEIGDKDNFIKYKKGKVIIKNMKSHKTKRAIDFHVYLKEQLKDPKVKKEYDNVRITDAFNPIIPLSHIKQKMSKRDFKRFEKWMDGQTSELLSREAGIYPDDLWRFLTGRKVID